LVAGRAAIHTQIRKVLYDLLQQLIGEEAELTEDTIVEREFEEFGLTVRKERIPKRTLIWRIENIVGSY
jgi:hypothetical protein